MATECSGDGGGRPRGGTLYPTDLTREELEAFVRAHPERADSLLGHTTLVRRNGTGLVAVPYEQEYRGHLAKVARALREASEFATHEPFRSFLRSRARGLLDGSLTESEALWIEACDSPIDIEIGPYEVYDDRLYGVKTCYEATVMVRSPYSDRVAEFAAAVPLVERELPGAAAGNERIRSVRVGVYDVAYTAGMTNMGAKAAAAMLPNDERVRMESGGRLLLFNNVIAAKFREIVRPVADRMIDPAQRRLVQEQPFLTDIVLHEWAHALSSCYVQRDGRATGTTINQALRERYSTIEECRADLLGVYNLALLGQCGILPREMLPAAAATFVVHCLRSLRFGLSSDYARAAAMTLLHLFEGKAVSMSATAYVRLDIEAVLVLTRELATKVQQISTHGDYGSAGELMERLARVPPPIGQALLRTHDLPVDLAVRLRVTSRLPLR